MIICYTVPEIYGARRIEVLFFIFGYFLTFHPPSSSKKKFRKMRKKTTATTTTTTCRYHHFTQVHQKSWSYAILFLRYMVCDRCNGYFYFWAIFCPFTALTAQEIKIKKNKKNTHTHTHAKTKKQLRWSTVPMIWCATDTRTEKVAYRGGCPTQKKSTLGWRKKNCRLSSLTQTLIYRSNMYYSKIYKREDWKTNSSTLHLEVRTSYFRHRYSINSLELQWI